MRVLFAGGGTGGHLFPALAIAREMEQLDRECVIRFVGTRHGIEATMSEQIGYPLSLIAMRSLPRRLSLGLITFPMRLAWSIIQSLRLCSEFRPDVVVGTGGYVSGPVIMAAALKKIPRALQEQNSYPGLVTRRLAARADIIFLAYRKAGQYLPAHIKTKITGNPIRRSLTGGNRAEALRRFGLSPERKTILILGGSQGARRINQAVLGSLAHIDDTIQLLWQCGKRDYTDVAARLNKKDFAISLFPFSNDMQDVYAAADLAIARAGALTIAELTACGIPMILIPYPQAAADHQTHNAAEVVAAGAAEMIADAALDRMQLLESAAALICSVRLTAMRQASKAMGRPEAASEIAREILRLAGYKGEVSDTTGNRTD